MEKDIKILENSLMKIDKKSFNNAGYIITDLTFQEFQAIQNLIQRNKELEDTVQKLRNTIESDFSKCVPKSKIKEKIEEIKNRRIEDGECELALHGFQREAKIEILQELLD